MIAYLGLGSNLGDRGEFLRSSLRTLSEHPSITLLQHSAFYETMPWGKVDQPIFLNAAASIETTLDPLELLREVHTIEKEHDRERREHWGARTLDIDLLICEESAYPHSSIRMANDELQLPHPHMKERAFVLLPLSEIAPKLKIHGRTVKEWLTSPAIQEDLVAIKRSVTLSSPYPLTLIACMDKERGIGQGGKLLTTISEDLALFRKRTTHQTIIYGRKTLETFPKGNPLPFRRNIILSQTLKEAPQDALLCHTKAELMELLGKIQYEHPQEYFYLAGGAHTYKSLLHACGDAYITEVDAIYGADSHLPPLDGFARTGSPTRLTGNAVVWHYVRV